MRWRKSRRKIVEGFMVSRGLSFLWGDLFSPVHPRFDKLPAVWDDQAHLKKDFHLLQSYLS